MNISKNFKIMSVFALAATIATASYAQSAVIPAEQDIRSEFITTDQPFVIFKAIKGGKYPFMFKCYPGMNQLDVVYFGTQKKSGVKFVKNPKELENLTPIRYSFKLADNTAVQVDKKYTGYREAYLGIGLENLFKATGLYPTAGYKGIALVDEYQAGLPMKWALCDVVAFKALKKYVLKGFDAANVIVPAVKPLLLLEIVNQEASLDASDYEFLNKYFDLLDPKDAIVKKFFDGATKTINSIADKAKDSLTVGAMVGETVLNALDGDKQIKGFEAEKIRDALLVIALGKLGEIAFSAAKDAAAPTINDWMAKCGLTKADLIKAATICCVAPAAGYLTYKIVTNLMAEAEVADDIETEKNEVNQIQVAEQSVEAQA